MKPKIGVYCFGYNLEKIAYPWRECLNSALELVGPEGVVYMAECQSEDDTWKKVVDFSKNKDNLILIRHPWANEYFKDPEVVALEGYKIQAVVANKLIETIGDTCDFILKLDMDEVLHEISFPAFWRYIETMQGSLTLGRPHYTHFSPDDKHTFPFIYDRKAVFSRTSLGLRYKMNKGGDACALDGSSEYDIPLEIYHYGKMDMGREREALYKEQSFTKLYKDLGFPDPKVESQAGNGYLDYYKVFSVAKENGDFKDFYGTHPKFVRDWLEYRRIRSELFWITQGAKNELQ